MPVSDAPGPMRPGLGSSIFVGVMLAASLATLLRVVVVAWHLPVEGFALYAAITATAAFLSTIISFGAVEGTIKTFPRLVGAGRQNELLVRSHLVLRRLALRAALAGIPIFAIGALLDIEWLRLCGIAFGMALPISYAGLLASMQRAAGKPVPLATGTVLRTVGVLLAVVPAVIYGNLAVVLAVEATATMLICFACERLYFRPRQADQTERSEDEAATAADNPDGLRLFIAYSLVAIPFYLDRMYVTSVMGRDEAGRYAILTIFLTAASLLVATLAQRVGPDAIRLVQRDGDPNAAGRQVLVWCGISGLLWLSAMAVIAVVFSSGMLPASLARYQIELRMLLPIAISGLLLNAGLIEFLLIALDRERYLLRAAGVFATVVVAGAIWIASMRWGLLELMWLLAGCRALYAICLLLSLPSREDRYKSRAA